MEKKIHAFETIQLIKNYLTSIYKLNYRSNLLHKH